MAMSRLSACEPTVPATGGVCHRRPASMMQRGFGVQHRPGFRHRESGDSGGVAAAVDEGLRNPSPAFPSSRQRVGVQQYVQRARPARVPRGGRDASPALGVVNRRSSPHREHEQGKAKESLQRPLVVPPAPPGRLRRCRKQRRRILQNVGALASFHS